MTTKEETGRTNSAPTKTQQLPENVTHLPHRQSPNNKSYRYFFEAVRSHQFSRR
ncbi:MAG: hypothetical protein RH949_08320 [Coleofasciculus sp. A1-SPW-01]|uniref:hypothetical protein n=1 Tax=Coleofasciculus sp. A1-SPW-01 TaxID=3070819 RepID=UPI0032F7A7B8